MYSHDNNDLCKLGTFLSADLKVVYTETNVHVRVLHGVGNCAILYGCTVQLLPWRDGRKGVLGMIGGTVVQYTVSVHCAAQRIFRDLEGKATCRRHKKDALEPVPAIHFEVTPAVHHELVLLLCDLLWKRYVAFRSQISLTFFVTALQTFRKMTINVVQKRAWKSENGAWLYCS